MTYALIDHMASDAIDRDLAWRDAQEAREDEIERRMDKLLAPGAAFDPRTWEHIAEAMGNPEGPEQQGMAGQIAQALHENRFAEAGRVLQSLSWAYWEDAAREKAREEIAAWDAANDDYTEQYE